MKHHLSHVSSVQPKAQTTHGKLWRAASAALALSVSASASAQLAPSAGQPPATAGTPPASAAVAAPPPAVCLAPLSASNMQGVANFVWAGCPQLLNWPHDAAPRMSGPAPSGKASVHGYVLNYYAPSVYTWLKAGRPAGGIPDGALILKQMYADNNGARGDVNGWALIIKQKSASYDGWLWGYVDPTKPKGGDGLFGGQFYDPNCVACHGSSSSPELTFAALVNIGNGPFGGTAMPVANGLLGGSMHSKLGLAATPAATAPAANPLTASYIPSQKESRVIVGANGPTTFYTSDVCAGCHDASNLAFGVQANMTWPQNLPPAQYPTTPLTNISPFGEWGASLMGLAGRDPVFQAQRETETLLYPSVAAEINNACYTCHGVMGQRQKAIDQPGSLFTHQDFLATSGPNATYGALARDGISCLACHRMTPDGLGTEASFTGKFEVTDPKTVFGPFKDVKPYPMQNSVGLTPKHGDAIADPAMCGSCHVVETPILDARKTYDRKSFEGAKKSHEQTTYLEWLNSAFQTKAPPKAGATPVTCQGCHMPNTMNTGGGKRSPAITSVIANIEDNTYVDAEGKPFPNTAALADITLTPRNNFSRHTFVGANVFVLEMFKQFGDRLGLTTGDPNYDTKTFKFVPRLEFSTLETVRQVQSDTASVALKLRRTGPNGLEVDVEVVNKTGHKFPSGVGFRRAYIEFSAFDPSGKVVWSSGRSTDKGVLIDDAGQPLVTEFSKTQWQPHQRLITSNKQVQIYESRDKDVAGLLTTSFLGLATQVKDNRLMPIGWQATGPYADWTKPVAVNAQLSPGYYTGKGNDIVTYRVPPALAPQVKVVRAVLYYQSIPPYYLQDRFAIGGNNPATAQLRELTEKVDYSKTAAKDWKLAVAAATSVVR